VGWQAAGTLMGALSVSARAREVLLPVLLFPVVLPLLIAAVQAAAGVLAEAPLADLAAPLALMVAYGVIFLIAGFLLYPVIVEAST
jgi:heme exporter protein B